MIGNVVYVYVIKYILFMLRSSTIVSSYISKSRNAILPKMSEGGDDIVEFCSLLQTNDKCTISKLRKAAGSKSLDELKEASHGWTSSEINNAGGDTGKNPVHRAAWQGCLDNLVYLVETMGCDVNQIATGKYCYGKTPIFFALTRSREDIVEYLLDQDAIVKIVNNKGQSILSIAASHVPESLIDRIQKKEIEQDGIEWQNYRATHSDHLEYGDLDPRFIDRPVRDSDIISALVLNPTTKHTRKGGFLRRNPLVERPPKTKSSSSQSRKVEDQESFEVDSHISSSANLELIENWDNLQRFLEYHEERDNSVEIDSNIQKAIACIQKIITINVERRESWMSQAAVKITQMNVSKIELLEFLTLATEQSFDREKTLINKLMIKIKHPPNDQLASSVISPSSKHRRPRVRISDHEWCRACELVQHYRIEQLEQDNATFLVLPERPVIIDNIKHFPTLYHALHNQPVVAIDSEWCDDENLSTLQIAFGNVSFVIDLLVGRIDSEYRKSCCKLIIDIFHEKIVLGFAINNDIRRLEEFVNDELCTTTNRQSVLDIQLLYGDMSQPPGLSKCTSYYSKKELSKVLQCSDWSHRPLYQAQIEYAALDAAILLYLLSEESRNQQITGE